MKTRNLEEAVYEIHDLCRERAAEDRKCPFLFLIGAGVSHPQVPLAAQIVRHCTGVARDKGRPDTAPAETDPLAAYSYWFERAFGHSSQRQGYLNSLIDGKAISRANLRLAHLLLASEAGMVPTAQVVVTPNFDDFLTRALRLFGKPCVVCDHPATSVRIDPERDDLLQVVHVHGTYHYYDCTNLTHEIDLAARGDEGSVQTMSALLDRLFHSRTPLVVGYSGWERDVIMRSLQRRLQHRLGANLYWFCYRRSQAEHLPIWLRNHLDVRLVVPEEAEKPAQSGRTEKEPTGLSAAAPADVGKTEPALPAHEVFERMLAAFGASEPDVTRRPLEFFARQLESLVPSEDLAEEGGLYGWSSVIARVRASEPSATSSALIEEQSSLEKMRQAIRSVDYSTAAQIGVELVHEGRLAENFEELLRMLFTTAERLVPAGPEQIEVVGAIQGLYTQLLERQATPTTDAQMLVARALNLVGESLRAGGRFERAIPYFEEVIRRFGENLDLREYVATSLQGYGICLGEMERSGEAIEVFDRVIDLLDGAKEEDLLEIEWAWYNKAVVLVRLGDLKAAEVVYKELVDRTRQYAEPGWDVLLTHALVNHASVLGMQESFDEARVVFLEALDLLKGRPESWAVQQAVLTYGNLCWIRVTQAKEHLLAGRQDEANRSLALAVESGRQGLESEPKIVGNVLNLAYAEFLSGRKSEARELLTLAVNLDPKGAKKLALEDSQKRRLPVDDEYDRMIRSISTELVSAASDKPPGSDSALG
jgi:tetratricopeptide (TPR) repeat protein